MSAEAKQVEQEQSPTARECALHHLEEAHMFGGSSSDREVSLGFALIYAVLDVADALRESKPVATEVSTWTSTRPLTWADVDLLRGANVVSEMTGDREPINDELAELADRIAERLPARELS